jgi:hypothetical protein
MTEARKSSIADAMVITQTGAVMFVEQPAIQRNSPNPQGEIIMIVAQFKKVERIEKSLVS